MKKIEEDVMVLDDQNNKLNKVRMKTTLITRTDMTTVFALSFFLLMYQEVIQMVTTTTVLNLTLLIYTGEEVAGREDL